MASIIFTSTTNIYISLFLCLLSLYFLIRLKQNLTYGDLVNTFIYFTHKINLFMFFLMFLLISIFSVIGVTDTQITDFFRDSIKVLIYYCSLNYGVFYGIKFIYFWIDFFKKNDLYMWGVIKLNKESKKE